MNILSNILSRRKLNLLFITLTLSIILFSCIALPETSAALTQDDLNSIVNQTPFYDPNATNGSGSTCTDTTTGAITSSISTNVPEPFRDIIAAGSAKYNADPDLVAAIFAEEHGASWPSPDGPWATSGTGAAGPMQFEPDTWAEYGVSVPGSGDNGTPDIQNLTDALYAAANFIASLGGTAGISLGDLQLPLQNGTALRVAAAYNWGPGAVELAGPLFPLTSLNSQTMAYVEGVYTMISSNFANMSDGGGGGPAPVSPVTTTDCSTASGSCTNGTVQQRIVQCAQAELALWESKQLNPGQGYFKYESGANSNAVQPWCADFASWIYAQAGAPMLDPDGNGTDVPYVGNISNQPAPFQFHPIDSGYTPVPGDLAIYGTAHVEIVVAVNSDGTLNLIGGDEGGVGNGLAWWSSSSVQPDPDESIATLKSGIMGAPIIGFESYNGN